MNLVSYLQFLEPVQEHVSRIYSTASEIIVVLLALWCINLLAGLIHRTFTTGKFIGKFYRSYIHPYLKSVIIKLLSVTINRNSIKDKSEIDTLHV